ncbi:MAG TPA: phosphatase PAP2 family protein [Methylotenera sp.]|nr:phosphatase PAP2 family protein [Methylotenera sp.]
MYQPFFLKNIGEYNLKFWLLHLILPLILAIFLLYIYPVTGLDAWLIHPFYDAKIVAFPLKQDWFLQNIMHASFKNMLIVVALTLLMLWLCGLKIVRFNRYQFKNTWLLAFHQQFLWVFVAMVISTSTISILKHFSNHACPWDLLKYGGDQPLFALFDALPFGAIAGHCFPGGHASGGFALMAFYFGFKDTQAKLANIGLVIGLVLGFTMGWAQMMRGAHFMSHNLWTAWIIWMLLLAQYLVWKPNSHRKP